MLNREGAAVLQVAGYVPQGRLDNLRRAAELGFSETFLEQKIGALQLARKAEGEETSDMAVAAVRALELKGVDLDDVDLLVVCTQNPDGQGLPHCSALVHAKLNLPKNCGAFDISLGCSGYVYGLAVVDGLLRSGRCNKAIFVTADPYSKIINPEDQNTSLLFGDAATATLIAPLAEAGRSALRIGPSKLASFGTGWEALKVDDTGWLSMNGRAVFNFAAVEATKQIENLLAQAHLDKEAIRCFLLHQGSRYIVETIAKRLGVSADKVPIDLTDYGNTVSSSIPLLLEKAMDEPGSGPIMISGFGVGLSYASMILNDEPIE